MYRNMKKLMILLAALAACAAAAAQTTPEEFQARYERLVRNVGYAGVGVETLLDRWEEAFPESTDVPVARFNYWFHKAQRTEIVPKGSQRKFLGNAPTAADDVFADTPAAMTSYAKENAGFTSGTWKGRQIVIIPAEVVVDTNTDGTWKWILNGDVAILYNGGDSAVNLSLRLWVPKADYWPARRDLSRGGKEALEGAGLTIPFPQRTCHIQGIDSGIVNSIEK